MHYVTPPFSSKGPKTASVGNKKNCWFRFWIIGFNFHLVHCISFQIKENEGKCVSLSVSIAILRNITFFEFFRWFLPIVDTIDDVITNYIQFSKKFFYEYVWYRFKYCCTKFHDKIMILPQVIHGGALCAPLSVLRDPKWTNLLLFGDLASISLYFWIGWKVVVLKRNALLV